MRYYDTYFYDWTGPEKRRMPRWLDVALLATLYGLGISAILITWSSL